MKKLSRHFLSFLMVFFLTGCMSHTTRLSEGEVRNYVERSWRFYSGVPRPQKEVALIMNSTIYDVTFPVSLDGYTIDQEMWTWKVRYGYPLTLEVLPGKHILGLGYKEYGSNSKSTGNTVRLNVDLKPGHVYVHFPEFPTQTTWKPVLIDLDELSKSELNRYGTTRRERARRRVPTIKESIPIYFQGKRVVYPKL